MESTVLQTWLKKKAIGAAAGNLFLSLLALIAGVVLLTVAFWFAYGVVWFGFNMGVSSISQLLFNQPLRLSHPLILAVCWVFLVLLFIGNARTSRDSPGTFSKGNYALFVPQSGVFG